jgi:hypothetical protein
MAGCIRALAFRRVLAGVAAVVAGWLVWRLAAHGSAPSAESVVSTASVLGWGLGLMPVHVKLGGSQGPAGTRRIRRPARTYERGRDRGGSRTASWTGFLRRTQRG